MTSDQPDLSYEEAREELIDVVLHHRLRGRGGLLKPDVAVLGGQHAEVPAVRGARDVPHRGRPPPRRQAGWRQHLEARRLLSEGGVLAVADLAHRAGRVVAVEVTEHHEGDDHRQEHDHRPDHAGGGTLVSTGLSTHVVILSAGVGGFARGHGPTIKPAPAGQWMHDCRRCGIIEP